jgi:outer membrane receptor for monomeric catechols
MKKILLPLVVASSMFASDLNLELTNETLMVNSTITIPNQNFAVRGGYLYNDVENSNNYYTLGIQAQGENALDNYNSRLAIFIDFDHTKNNSAIPIGIGIYNNQFGNLQYPLFAKAEVAYAPAVLSFNDATRLFKTKVELGLKPIENAKVYIGYRDISFNHNYQSVAYFGIGFVF